MDRSIVYAGAGAQDTDLLFGQRGAMVSLGMLSELVLGNTVGSGPRVLGLAVQPTSPASMQIVVGRGALFGWDYVDATAYGSLGQDTAHSIVQCGVNLDAITTATLAPPTGAGQAICYLVQAQASQTDTGNVVLPFWNAAVPTQPYLGQNNSGGALPTQRVRRVSISVKAGTVAVAGSQIAPVADSGWVPLAVVTLVTGQTSIGSANIASHISVPTVPYTLPQLAPGYVHRLRLTGSGTWTVPAGVTRIRVTRTGGGGGGGSCQANGENGGANVAGGGGAGATEIDDVTVTPGQAFTYVQGLGGAAQSDGLATQFSGLVAAAPGKACTGFTGSGGLVFSAGGFGGTATASGFSGGDGADGQNDPFRSYGHGGASYWGGGGRAVGTNTGRAGQAPGSGGGGAYDPTASNIAFSGGAGANGLILIEY